MDFSTFDTTELDQYTAQAKEKWGKTEAWKEFEEKTAGQDAQTLQSTGSGLMDIFAKLGAIRHLSPASRIPKRSPRPCAFPLVGVGCGWVLRGCRWLGRRDF